MNKDNGGTFGKGEQAGVVQNRVTRYPTEGTAINGYVEDWKKANNITGPVFVDPWNVKPRWDKGLNAWVRTDELANQGQPDVTRPWFKPWEPL